MTSNAMQWLKTRRIASCARRERTQVLPYMVTTLDFGHKQCLQGAKLLSEGACRLQPTLTASQRQDRQLHVTNVTLPSRCYLHCHTKAHSCGTLLTMCWPQDPYRLFCAGYTRTYCTSFGKGGGALSHNNRQQLGLLCNVSYDEKQPVSTAAAAIFFKKGPWNNCKNSSAHFMAATEHGQQNTPNKRKRLLPNCSPYNVNGRLITLPLKHCPQMFFFLWGCKPINILQRQVARLPPWAIRRSVL